VYDFGRDGGLPYLVMELLEGDTLADRLAGGPLPPAEAARIGAVVADALDAAHGRGIIHRLLDKAFSGRRAEPQSRVWCRRRKASSAQRSTASPPGVVLDAIRSS
jgi:serine/threonine protein kinase